MDQLRVTESFQDDLVFERAFVGRVYQALAPLAVVGGVTCSIQTRRAALDVGFAMCEPVDLARLDAWPMLVVLSDGAIVEGASADPAIVAAAKHFVQLEEAGELFEGMCL